MQYAGALLITNKITPAKPTTNRKPGNGPSAWQQGLKKQIDKLRSDLSIIDEHHWEHQQEDLAEVQDHPEET